jgi:hypothetical protein
MQNLRFDDTSIVTVFRAKEKHPVTKDRVFGKTTYRGCVQRLSRKKVK